MNTSSKPNKAYYNEIDPFAAAWLRELMKQDLIPQGDVDERSIEDVRPSDLVGYTQCHFFAGIGVWPYALRLAGWPDNRPVWTGSCPCQSFSSAGQGQGFADERHLWPSWFHLIRHRKPSVLFGEQVEAAIRFGWLDLVQSDLEDQGYRIGTSVLGACSVGAPHIRQRLFFVADTHNEGSQGRSRVPECASELASRTGGLVSELADSHTSRLGQGRPSKESDARDTPRLELAGLRNAGALADAASVRRLQQRHTASVAVQGQRPERNGEHAESEYAGELSRGFEGLCGTSGFWRDAEWIACRDGKHRPTESGTFPLAHGAPARVGRLRGYGNAIVAPVAQAFIEAYLAVENKLVY